VEDPILLEVAVPADADLGIALAAAIVAPAGPAATVVATDDAVAVVDTAAVAVTVAAKTYRHAKEVVLYSFQDAAAAASATWSYVDSYSHT
jgi:hypothetical protein